MGGGVPGRTGHLAAEKIIWRAEWEEETTKLETNLIPQPPVSQNTFRELFP